MAKMTCKCGEYLSITAAPNNVQLKVFTDFEWEKIVDMLYDQWDKMSLSEKDNEFLLEYPKNDVWRCPKCERIYVFEPHNDKAIKVYKLEE